MFSLTGTVMIVDFFQGSVRYMTPIMLTALGLLIAERSGVINIGIEGTMLVGAFTGFAVASVTGSLWIGMLLAILAGVLVNLIFAYAVISLRAPQVVVGTAINILCLGITGFLFRGLFTGAKVIGPVSIPTFQKFPIPLLSSIPFLGEIFFNQNIIVYMSLVAVLVIHYVLFRSAVGIKIIAVGEHPRAAESLGISVLKVRYLSVMFSGAMAGLGGAFLTIAHANTFVENMTSGRGFIALAVSIMGRRTPIGVFLGGLLFGGANALQLRIQSLGLEIAYDLILMIPYIFTIIAVTIFSRNQIDAPSSLGVPYEKS